MSLPLPLRRVLPGILPLALALCSAPRIEACDKDKTTTSTTTTPVVGEPDVGAMAAAPIPPVTILELIAQHPAPDTRTRGSDLQPTGRWATPRTATSRAPRGAQAVAPPRATPPVRARAVPDATRPPDRAPVANGRSGAAPDRQVSRPHRMPGPEIL